MNFTPIIDLPVAELGRRTRERVLADLDGRSLDVVGGAYWADILFVTTRARDSLDSTERDALAKATGALGYTPVQSALYCATDNSATEDLPPYVEALSPHTLVFLEAVAVPTSGKHLLPQDKFPYCKVVVVSDFFASLPTVDKKRQSWQELKPATRKPALR